MLRAMRRPFADSARFARPYLRLVPAGAPLTRHLLVASLVLPPDENENRDDIHTIHGYAFGDNAIGSDLKRQ